MEHSKSEWYGGSGHLMATILWIVLPVEFHSWPQRPRWWSDGKFHRILATKQVTEESTWTVGGRITLGE
jgi:hypothetical protein